VQVHIHNAAMLYYYLWFNSSIMNETQPPSAEMNPSASIRIYEQQSSCMVTISQVLLLYEQITVMY